MKLYHLKPITNEPWDPWYDCAFGFVIRAESEQQAREMANIEGGNESNGNLKPWLDPNHSECVELTKKGEAEVILKDFAKA